MIYPASSRHRRLLEPRFSDLRHSGSQFGEELDQIVMKSIEDRSKWDLFPKAAQARMLFGLVQTPLELADCPQLESRKFYREIEHPVIGKIKVPAVLFNLSLTPYCPAGTGANAGPAQPRNLRGWSRLYPTRDVPVAAARRDLADG